MSACRWRPEDGCIFTTCATAFPKDRKCRCAEEVRAEVKGAETRVARVPDSARTNEGEVA